MHAHLKTFKPNSSHFQILSKLLLYFGNDQLMWEKLGNTILVLEVKRSEDRSVSKSSGHVSWHPLHCFLEERK